MKSFLTLFLAHCISRVLKAFPTSIPRFMSTLIVLPTVGFNFTSGSSLSGGIPDGGPDEGAEKKESKSKDDDEVLFVLFFDRAGAVMFRAKSAMEEPVFAVAGCRDGNRDCRVACWPLLRSRDSSNKVEMLEGTVERDEGGVEGKSSARRWVVVLKARRHLVVVDEEDALVVARRPEPSSRTLASILCGV